MTMTTQKRICLCGYIALFGLLFTAFLSHTRSNADEAEEYQKKEWEYRIEQYLPLHEKLLLNTVGKEGWELIHVTRAVCGELSCRAIFKRPRRY